MFYLPSLLRAALCAAAVSAVSAYQVPRPSGNPPGILIDIGSHKLHLNCIGPAAAKPVVILEAGGGAYSTAWAVVQKALGPTVHSCAYDRAGLGWSEDGPQPRTMSQEAFELHALLAAANIPGPYVLAGHSIGGLIVRLYAEKYPNEVAGVVLAASTHESARLGVVGRGWVRVRELATGQPIPEPIATMRKAPETQVNYFAEQLRLMYLARLQTREALGDRPLIVLAPTRIESPPPGTSEELWRDLRVEKDDQAMGLVLLSRNSKLIRDPSSGHGIQTDNPALVARAIRQVIDAVVNKTPLEPK
jgi:pimeloyl-ACP methyl ester carboxylesterase